MNLESILHPSSRRWTHVLCILGLVIAGVLIYSNTFHSPFVFDDINSITKNNPYVHMTDLSWDQLREAVFKSRLRTRSIPNISFALNHYFGRENTFGYHVVNLCIHLLTGILLFLFVKYTLLIYLNPSKSPSRTLSEKKYSNIQPLSIAFFTALLWLMHPLQTNTVTYICQRMAGMAALFYLAAMLFYIKARCLQRELKPRKAIGFFAGALFFSLCAFVSKENSAVLPLFILLYEWFFFQDLKNIFKNRNFIIVCAVLILSMVMIALVYLGENPLHRITAVYDQRKFTLPQRVITEFRVVAYYISLIVYPRPGRLNLDYDYPLSDSLVNPLTTFWSMLMIAGLFGLALYTAKKNRLFSFCILWFLGNLVIESSVIGLEIIFEHRLYLPMMLLCLLFVSAVFKSLRPAHAGAALTIIAVLMGIWTYQRNLVWKTDIAFWSDIAKKSPEKARPYQNLAYSLQQKEQYAEAVRYYRKSLEFELHPVACFNLGLALAKMGHYAEAMEALTTAVKMNYRTPGVFVNLAYVLTHMGEFREALDYFETAAKMAPDDENLQKNIQELKKFLKSCKNPINCVQERISRQPGNAALYYKLGVMREQRRELDLAQKAYETVLKKLPESDQKLYLLALNRLGVIAAAQGDGRRALDLFEKAAHLSPSNPYFYYQTAVTYAGMKNRAEAVKWLDRAVEKGFSDIDDIKSDPRWQFIHNTPYYRYLLNRLPPSSRG